MCKLFYFHGFNIPWDREMQQTFDSISTVISENQTEDECNLIIVINLTN